MKVYKSVLTDKICDIIISEGLKRVQEEAGIEEDNKKLYDIEKELHNIQKERLCLCEEELKKEKEKNTELFKDMDKRLRSTNNMISAKSMISTGHNIINRELKNLKALNEKYAITDEEDI